MSTATFRNDAGADVIVFSHKDHSDGGTIITGTTRVAHGKTFSTDVDDKGLPINPSIKVWLDSGSIVPSSAPTTRKPKKGPRSRNI